MTPTFISAGCVLRDDHVLGDNPRVARLMDEASRKRGLIDK